MRSKAALALVAAALLAGGCSQADPSTISGARSATTIAAAGAPATSAGGPASMTAGPGSGTRRTIVVGGTDAVPPNPHAPTNPGAGGPGSAAGWFLRPTETSRIVVQVLTQSGAEPAASTVDRVAAVLRAASGKPVTMTGGRVAASHDTWTTAQIRDGADAVPASAPAGTAVLRILFVHGRSDKGDDVLGITPRGDVTAIFSDRVAASESGLGDPHAVERAVTTHEVGHVLGLVDLFLSTGRADKDHPGHSTNRQSVMYWAVESSLVGDLLTGGPPQNFDDADLADLATIRHG
jgi:hypothetical protein